MTAQLRRLRGRARNVCVRSARCSVRQLAAASINHDYAPTTDVTAEHRHSAAFNLLLLLKVESSQVELTVELTDA